MPPNSPYPPVPAIGIIIRVHISSPLLPLISPDLTIDIEAIELLNRPKQRRRNFEQPVTSLDQTKTNAARALP